MTSASSDLKTLIASCNRGDSEARAGFQETYGALIYSFPVRVFHLSREEAGEFYLYVLEDDRIFKRVRSFEGRNAMQFETYLMYYVLRDLFLEWTRGAERIDVVSLDSPLKGDESDRTSARTMHDVLATADASPDAAIGAVDALQEVTQALQQVDGEKRILLKLLTIGTLELEPEDVRLLAQLASRSLYETLALLDEVHTTVSVKAVKAQEKQDALQTVAYWIQTYQRHMAEIEARITASRFQDDVATVEQLTQEKAELARKLAWRYQQQARLREEWQAFDVRPSYKDIARLLNIPVGTVCSRLARAREAFEHQLTLVRTAAG